MKQILLASTVLFAASSAYAADAVVYTEPAPVVVDTFSWTGGYIGVNAGYAGGKFKHPIDLEVNNNGWTNVGSGSLNLNSSGFVGGIQAGYNWQFDKTIVGIETDIQVANLKGEISANINGVGGIEAGSKINWFGTTRVRLGYTPVDRFMVYATGGVAYGKVKTYAGINAFGGGAGISNSETRVGYTVGAGAEYAFTNNWTMKSEYLYTDLGKSKFTLGDDFARINVAAKTPFHTVRVGLNYKF